MLSEIGSRKNKTIDNFPRSFYINELDAWGPCGEVAEWLKAPLSKSGNLAKTGFVGSNPTLSATPCRWFFYIGTLSVRGAAAPRFFVRRDDRVG